MIRIDFTHRKHATIPTNEIMAIFQITHLKQKQTEINLKVMLWEKL